jgi:lipoprotein-releasing system ATP-binding protein
MKYALKAEALTKTFIHPENFEILKGIDLSLERGKSIAIVGKSGSGKSTLLHILGALDEASSGKVEICGELLSKENKADVRNKNIGFLFQAFHLLEECTVLENVLMPARIGRRPIDTRSAEYARVEQLLEEVQLQEKKNSPVKNLSGGEKQRVGLVRALCNDPDILLADEPTGNLDSSTSQIIHDLLMHYVKKRNKALLVVTHDPHLAQLCDLTYELSNGVLRLCN